MKKPTKYTPKVIRAADGGAVDKLVSSADTIATTSLEALKAVGRIVKDGKMERANTEFDAEMEKLKARNRARGTLK